MGDRVVTDTAAAGAAGGGPGLGAALTLLGSGEKSRIRKSQNLSTAVKASSAGSTEEGADSKHSWRLICQFGV